MVGKGILFQDYDKTLAKRLKEILNYEDEKILICMPGYYYSSTKMLHDHVKYFVRAWVKENRNLIDNFYNENKQYYATELSQLYASYKRNMFDFTNYFKAIKQIWIDRDIAVHGLSLLLEYVDKENLCVLCNATDDGIDTWQPSLLKAAIENDIEVKTLDECYGINGLIFISLE